MSKIEELRNMKPKEGYGYSEEFEIVEDILVPWRPDGYTSERVYGELEDGGRWTNYETKVYKLIEGDEVAFFKLFREVPATEIQECGDYYWSFYEVEPYEETVVKYRPLPKRK